MSHAKKVGIGKKQLVLALLVVVSLLAVGGSHGFSMLSHPITLLADGDDIKVGSGG